MGWGQILTLKNDPTCISAQRVFIKFKLYWDGVGSILTLKNDPICSFAQIQILTLIQYVVKIYRSRHKNFNTTSYSQFRNKHGNQLRTKAVCALISDVYMT